MRRIIHVSVYSLVATLLAISSTLHAETKQPLHTQIDRLVSAAAKDVQLGVRSSDEEFIRRVYLDLAGRIPSIGETRAFLNDKNSNKRTGLIDQLLSSSDYPRRMQELFHAMLMERRADNEAWLKFLRNAFEQNMPWDTFVRTIMNTDIEEEAKQGAAFFYTARLVAEGAMAPVDVPGLTRDVGRLFAGVDLQCAQCHDHLTVDDYKQQQFQGLHMIFENLTTRRDVKFPAVAEKVMTKPQEFKSVFIQVARTTNPVIPGGKEIEIKTFEKGEEFLVAPDNKTRTPGVPKFSPLTELGLGLASAENELFCRNIANRLWFVMMGRGLIEPLDLQHAANPPTHPKLIDLLATEFAAHNFDVKWLLREIVLSESYQRTGENQEAADVPEETTYALAVQKRVSAEQLFWSALYATGELDRLRAVEKPNDEGGLPTDEQLVEKTTELKDLRKSFLDAFANPPKEPEVEFAPSVKGALFVMNGEPILTLLKRQPGNLIDRLAKLPDDQAANGLFLSVLTRSPSEEDLQDAVAYLEKHKTNRDVALGHLAWALMASTEFCVNH